MQALNVIENARFEADKPSKLQVVKSNQLNIDALFLRTGQVHGPYRLPDRDRSVIVLQGKGELVLHVEPVDQRIDLAPGTIAMAPRATWYAIRNTGPGDLIVALAAQFPVRVEERG